MTPHKIYREVWVMLDPNGRMLIDTLDFQEEADVWQIVLGWPDGEEIERAKREGYCVFRARVFVEPVG